MEWFPFDVGEGEALSLDIDIGNPDLETPEIQISRYGDGGELVAAETVDDVLEAAAQPLADAPAGEVSPGEVADPLVALDAVFESDDDPIWVGFDHMLPAAAADAADAAAVSLIEDTVVFADADDDTAVDLAAAADPAIAPAETLYLADVFGEDAGDMPQALQTPDSSLERTDEVSTANTVLGEAEPSHAVVVVLGGDHSDDLYYIDYII